MNAVSLRDALAYDAVTGRITWLIYRGGGAPRIGEQAGTLHEGYIKVRVNRREYAGHRLAWFLHHGCWPTGEIDHINGNRVDNRLSNLRDVSKQANQQNVRHARSNSKTGLLGVIKDGGRFRAQLRVDGRRVLSKTFDTAEQASAAYMAAKAIHHGGFVPCQQ